MHVKIPSEPISLLPNALDAEFKCAVCLSVMQRPMVIPECMHRFCHTCIDDALRLGRKECPTCRTKCVSKRSLRPDIKMEKLIRLFYPDLEHAIHEKDLEAAREAREQHDVNAELYYKALARQQSKKKRKDPFSRLKSLDLEVLTDTGSVDVSVQQVKILLRHAKEDKALEFEIDKNDTVLHLKHMLFVRLKLQQEINIGRKLKRKTEWLDERLKMSDLLDMPVSSSPTKSVLGHSSETDQTPLDTLELVYC